MALGYHNIQKTPQGRLASRQSVEIVSKEGRLLALTADERLALAVRFWSRVDRRGPDECWPWQLSCFTKRGGHGQFTYRVGGKQEHFYAHRIAWLLTSGASAGALKACHKCDNPPCCNPAHIFLGTQADNLADARQKGRLDESRPRTRVFTLTERLAIMNAPTVRGSNAALARQYGVTKVAITHIRNGRFARNSRRVQQPRQPLPPAAEHVGDALDLPHGPFERVPSVQLPVLGEVH